MNGLAGTGPLVKAAIRRDRVMVTVTLLLLAILVATSDRATRNLYPNGTHIPAGLIGTMRNPAFVALYGSLPQHVSIDAIGISKLLLPSGFGVAILAQVIVRRHTRTEEESGLSELVGAQAVGRQAPLTAALTLATGTVLLGSAAAVIGLCLIGAPVAGAVDFGLCWLVLGLTGAAVAAVAVQVAGTTRGAGQLGLITLGALYLIRMIGDTTAPELSWLSPLGWATKSEPFGANRYWILLPGLVLCALLVLGGYKLLARRDLGAGLIRQRGGRARGRISGNPGLVWRLLRGTVFGWFVAFTVLGVVVGSLTSTLTGSSDTSVQNMLRTLGGGRGSFVDLYLATEISICALIATAAGITVTSHLAAEERARRLDPLLATTVSRSRLLTPYACAALALPAGLILLFTTAIWLADRLTGAGVQLELAQLLRSGAATFPAMWTVVATGVLLFGIRQAWVPLSWAILVLAGTVAQFGGLLFLPTWARAWSPFDHLASFPATELNNTTLALLTAAAGLILTAGIVGFRRRQID